LTPTAETETPQPSGTTHRIVVGVDGSPSSAAALEWAARQAELTGSAIEAITTWEWPSTYGWAIPFSDDYDPASDAHKVLETAVDTLRATHPDLDVRLVVVEGHPAPALVKASRGADLLVVGSRGHGEFAGMLLGSVSEHCVANGACPVLVLRDAQ
jgi:nucleotide-binding universal stress UspA family protein